MGLLLQTPFWLWPFHTEAEVGGWEQHSVKGVDLEMGKCSRKLLRLDDVSV